MSMLRARTRKGHEVFGLFRLTDPKGDGSYSSVEMLREWRNGAGEHGAHGIVLAPDKQHIFTVCGNFTEIPSDLAATSPHKNYADDLALPRAEDGNGFGAGKKPPGGFITRMDLDGKNAEVFASGERNTYDIAFNGDGELFGFDSDMEWDWGTPWYRPIRVFHAASACDGGFREGTAKWPEYYADSLPAVVDIGLGCPTGVVFRHRRQVPREVSEGVLHHRLDLRPPDGRAHEAQRRQLRSDLGKFRRPEGDQGERPQDATESHRHRLRK